MYDSKSSYVVFDNKFWWGDEWDPIEYGFDYDFSKSFFLQFSELLHKTPLASLSIMNSINSEYTNFVDGNKNCYLIFGSGWNENVQYGNKLFSCKDSQDLLMCTKCELSYECEGCIDSNRIIWCRNSKDCIDSYMLYNCRNCINCFGCADLVNKSYCIWNKQYSREKYFEELSKLKINSYSNFLLLKKSFIKNIYLKTIHKYANILSSVNSIGDNINHSKNCKNCFDIYRNVEDSKYLFSALDLKNSYDGNGVFENELSYEYVDCNTGHKNFSTVIVYNSTDISYSFNCHNCQNCFGCTGLRNKKYCILNKQYTKEEYWEILPKIISHMNDMPFVDRKGRVYKYGEFFPSELSPFSYNETIVQEYFPLNVKNIASLGYNWKDKEKRDYKIDFKSNELPDSIDDVNHSFINKIVECEHFFNHKHESFCDFACTEAFKITSEDFQFYKRMNLPLPRLCPNCRHYQRLKQRNPLKLWHRQCMCDKESHNHKGKCTIEFETSYAPDRPEIVYCEKCYQQEVY